MINILGKSKIFRGELIIDHRGPTDLKRLFDHSQILYFGNQTMLCGVEIVNTLTSAAACTATQGKSTRAFPVSKALGRGSGVVARRAHSPPFQGGVAAPLIRRSRSLAAQTGWFVISNKIRIATRAYKEATLPFIAFN